MHLHQQEPHRHILLGPPRSLNHPHFAFSFASKMLVCGAEMSEHSMHPNLRAIAIQAMLSRGFLVQFPVDALEQVKTEAEPSLTSLTIRDLSSWLWSSIDNDDSRDLDQVEYAKSERGATRMYIGIADVDWFVPFNSSLDRAAQHNTTSVYTGVATFPMLPERLSTDLSSLNEGVKRLAVVTEILVDDTGNMIESSIYSAIVQNKSQLTYNAVAAWLEGKAAGETAEASRRTLQKISGNKDLQEQLKLQDKVAGLLRDRRHEAGALTFQTSELQPVLSPEGTVIDLESRRHNRASFLIEDLMIAANQVTATFLDKHGLSSIRRVVRNPERWERIVALAASLGGTLPGEPDAQSLETFLKQQQESNPAHFADLSLAVIKLLGRGEYEVKLPGRDGVGHFGLAVQNYSHSTAPNRRYPDLITQRLLKAAFAGKTSPYSAGDLEILARHCTEKEDDANKVERLVKKCAAATMLASRVGQQFEAVVSGVSADGAWVRLQHPPVDGKLLGPAGRVDVGQRVRVRLVSVNPEKGFIDFELK
jgi:exoribonuclease-2